MTYKIYLLLAILLISITATQAQTNVGVNTNTPDASAALDVSSTTQGMLVPRMTASQRGLISSPATGLLVYQTDAPAGFYYNNGTPASPTWTSLSGGSSLPTQTGNAGKVLTTDGTNASWSSDEAAIYLYDNNNNKLGKLLSIAPTGYTVLSSTGYIVNITPDGLFAPSQLYWTGNCTGTPYLNSGGGVSTTGKEYIGKYLSYSLSAYSLYIFTTVVNNVATSAHFTASTIENNASGCSSNSGTKDGWELTAITNAAAGFLAPYPFALPLKIQ